MNQHCHLKKNMNIKRMFWKLSIKSFKNEVKSYLCRPILKLKKTKT